jgi:multimeric flavodoxin WrbA
MLTILGINGSPRKSATYRSLEIALAAAEASAALKTVIVSLHGKTIKPCIHCNHCKNSTPGHCPIKDYMQELYPVLRDADAYLFASPVYVMNVTPQIHAMFSRMRALHNSGAFRNKPAAAIAVGAGRNGGQELVINAIFHAAITRGMLFVGNEPDGYHHSGGSVWSKDLGAQGVDIDETGLESITLLGKRLAEITCLLNGVSS